MRHYDPLFDEFAAALQFPWYFGANGNAFDECITDLSWLPPGIGYVFVLTDPAETLADTDDGGLAWLVRSLSRAVAGWGRPVEAGSQWDRPSVPLHVVLQADESTEERVRAIWAAAGAPLGSIE